jgi:PAS domain S-box-containing protein
LFDLIADAVVVGDTRTGRVVLWNPAASRIFGYSTDEAVGMPIATLVPETLKASHLAGLARFRDGGSGPLVDHGRTVELPAWRKDGRDLWVELSLTSLADAPVPGLVLALIRDVTDRHQAQEAASAANESLKEFLAMAAHDVRTPLTAISQAGALLEERSDSADPAAAELLRIIRRQVGRLQHLIDDLLTVTSLDAGVIEARPATVAVDAALRSATRAAGCGPETRMAAAPGVAAWADPDHFERIMVNLLSNALRHGAPPIEIDVVAGAGTVEVRVRDRGPGVPAEFLPRLFDHFARADPSSHSGTGLGTAIAHGLARINGGDLGYEPNQPTGACFVLTLPVAGYRLDVT